MKNYIVKQLLNYLNEFNDKGNVPTKVFRTYADTASVYTIYKVFRDSCF